MSVSIKDNHPKIKIDTKNSIPLALRYMLDGIDEEAFYKTPKDQGELRKNLRKSVIGTRGTIEWKSRYAVYQERGYGSGPIRNYTTPGTGPHYAENAVNKVIREADKYLRKARLL